MELRFIKTTIRRRASKLLSRAGGLAGGRAYPKWRQTEVSAQ